MIRVLPSSSVLALIVSFSVVACKPQGATKVPTAEDASAYVDTSNDASSEDTSDSADTTGSAANTAATTPATTSTSDSAPLAPATLIAADAEQGSWFALNNVNHPAYCADLGLISPAEGGTTYVYPCRYYAASNQTIRLVKTDKVGYYLIQSQANTGFCLKAAGITDLAAVTLSSCSKTAPEQRWTVSLEGTQLRFVNENSKRALHLGADTLMQVATVGSTAGSQLWTVYTIPTIADVGKAFVGANISFKNVAYDTACIELPSTVEGSEMNVAPCKATSTANQNWQFKTTSIAGVYLIQSQLDTSLCMKVTTLNDFTNIKIAKCNADDPSMRWLVRADGNYFIPVNDYAGRALHWGSGNKLQDAQIGKTENAQKWLLVRH